MPLSPDTAEPLEATVVDGFTLFVCRHTGGIWFPEEAIAAMRREDPAGLETLDRSTSPTEPVQIDPSKSHVCPIDGSQLIHYHFQDRYDVVIEQCLTCGGIWVPHSELDKIVAIHGPSEEPQAHHVPYPKNQFGDYDDTLPPTPEPPNISPEARAAVNLMGSQTQTTIDRAHAFQQFWQVVDYNPFRVYIGRRSPFQV